MKSPSPASVQTLALDPESGRPLYRQIYQRVREAIGSGRLAPGERLPSARNLAAQIGAARGTVDTAYGLLAAEGYILARGPAGTVVSPALAQSRRARVPPGAELRPMPPDPPAGGHLALPFRVGLPALDAFPRARFSRLIARRARALDTNMLAYPDPAGLLALRQALVGYLAVSRGITCRPEQVFITAGYQAALGLIARVLLSPGDEVWFEDPGYFLAREALRAAGARLVAVPVDHDGMQIEAAIEKAPAARFAVLTPAHQSPQGSALSLPRRLALLSWAKAAGAFVIEDDYDSEFRYVGRPLPALKSLDRDQRVLYAGTFSKVLFPGLRLGYLVVPDSQIGAFMATCRAFLAGPAAFAQGVVADFIQEGHFARHLKRMRVLYAGRRAALASALEVAFGQRISLTLAAGGMHLLAAFPEAKGDAVLAERARTHGLAPTALSALCIERRLAPTLLLGFTNIPESEADLFAGRLALALAPPALGA